MTLLNIAPAFGNFFMMSVMLHNAIKEQDSFMGPVFVCSNERVLKECSKKQCLDISSSEDEAEDRLKRLKKKWSLA